MRIGYVLENFSPLSESFIRREILELCRADCQVFVYAGREHYGPRVPEPRHANLFTREVPISNVDLLTKAAFADGIDHLHGSLMSSAHRATFAAARVAQVPFTLMAYSGHDIFRNVQPKLYAAAANHPLCISIVVEDLFMREWMIEHYGVAADKIRIIPNSLDLDLYRLAENRIQGERITILSIARFVEKKGLIYLIEAFDRLSKRLGHIELWLVGYGPEGDRLTAAAAGNDRIKFLGPLSEEETRRLYSEADIFCLPCIRLENGDADGVPTTVLEAMAFELPVLTTRLLTIPDYVRDGVEGLLVSERDVDAIAGALKSLCLNAELRARMGRAGRASVVDRCDLKVNTARLLQIFADGRRARLRERFTVSANAGSFEAGEQKNRTIAGCLRALNELNPSGGKLLDLQCGLGEMRAGLNPAFQYYGCAFFDGARRPVPLVVATPEGQPFADNTFDAVTCHSALVDCFDARLTLAEIARILKPGGQLLMLEHCGDPDPSHINHFSVEKLRQWISENVDILTILPAEEHSIVVIGKKPDAGKGQLRDCVAAKPPALHSKRIATIADLESPCCSLAIDGGKPVRSSFLPFGKPCLGEEEINEVVATLRSGWIGTGPRAELFEHKFAEYIGVKHAISLSSCTAGLFLSLIALGVGPGSEVITTPLTFAATINVIEHVGARPVLVDIDAETLNIDPAKIEQAITSRTRALMPVHFGGLANDMNALERIAQKHGLAIIEDAAHAMGTRYEGRNAGAWGDLGAFSFYANKSLTTAEGGMVTTNDSRLAHKIQTLRLHGLSVDAWKRFGSKRLMKSDVVMPGYKFNMPDLSAAIGIHQLAKQEVFLQIRQRYARLYDLLLSDLPIRRQPSPQDSEQNRHGLHLYLLILEEGRWRKHRDDVLAALLRENIGAALHYRAIHTHPFYKDKYGYRPEDYPQANRVGEQILSLPLSPSMTEGDALSVVHAVRKVAQAYAE